MSLPFRKQYRPTCVHSVVEAVALQIGRLPYNDDATNLDKNKSTTKSRARQACRADCATPLSPRQNSAKTAKSGATSHNTRQN
jgi:hypothetical protein